MGHGVTGEVSFKVPAGEGYIIGDILRKYAVRSVWTWQVIGYRVDSQTVNFGFSNGAKVSYLELLKGRLVSLGEEREHGGADVRLCTFDWDGECFTTDGFDLVGLNPSVGNKVTACIYFGHGHRSADQNREVIKKLTDGADSGFFIVPSAHSEVGTFKYSIDPIDDRDEWLHITSNPGAVDRAIDAAVKTLSGLDR